MKNKYLVAGLLLSSLAITNTAVDAAVEDVKDATASLVDTAVNKLADVKNTAENLANTPTEKVTDIAINAKDLEKKALDATNKTLESKNTTEESITSNDSKDKKLEVLTPVLKQEATQEKANLKPETFVSTTKVETTNKLKPLTKTTTTTVVKELNLVETTKHNWWKWLGLLALLGALLGFLAATFKRRDHEKETNNQPRKNRNSDREVEFTFEEEKEDKGSDKRHYNKDFKNRD